LTSNTGPKARRAPLSRELSIAELAALWLALERAAVAKGNESTSEARARDAASAFEEAIRAASPEELLLAWETARQVQAGQEMGSQAWLEARSVSELLRAEYAASRASE
jgi:hypothetical protein